MAEWQVEVLSRLRLRNQPGPLEETIKNYNELWLKWEYLQKDCTQLEYERNRLQRDLSARSPQGEGGGDLGLSVANAKAAELEMKLREREQKYEKQNDELTTLLREKSELSTEVNKLNKELSNKDHQIAERDVKIEDLDSSLETLRSAMERKESELKSEKSARQTLQDEMTTLSMTYESIQSKYKASEHQNEQLITEVLEYKSKLGDHLNDNITLIKNNKELKKKVEELTKELENLRKKGSPGTGRTFFDKIRSKIDSQDSLSLPSPMPLVVEHSILPAKKELSVEAHVGSVSALCFSSGGNYMATGGDDKLLHVWRVDKTIVDPHNLYTLRGCGKGVTSAQFDFDERNMLASSNDGTVRLWSLQDHRMRLTLNHSYDAVLVAKFFHDARRVVSGGHDRTIKLWDISSGAGKILETIPVGSMCNDLVPGNGETIISGHVDKVLRIRDVRSKSDIQIKLSEKISSLDLSSNGEHVICCCKPKPVVIVNVRERRIEAQLSDDDFFVNANGIRCAYSPDNRYVAVGSANGQIFVWDAKTHNKATSFASDKEAVTACSWHSSGQYFVSVGHNRKAVFWV